MFRKSVIARQISNTQAEFIFHTWEGDGVLFISIDEKTDDLIIEPSTYSSRMGLSACRWNMSGIKDSMYLVAPFYQGVKLKLDDPLLKDSLWKWPFSWEAGLVILESKDCDFWLHTKDTQYRFKSLQTGSEDPFALGFDSDTYGPLENQLSAGGISWRINTFIGDWNLPAKSSRKWYCNQCYDLWSNCKVS